MARFTDAKGNSWVVEVNIATLKSLRTQLNVDLLEILNKQDSRKACEDLGAIFEDVILVVDMIYVLCQKQANERGISDIEFGESMSGESVEEALQALLEGLRDFFPRTGRQGLILETMIRAMKKVQKHVEDDIQRLRNSNAIDEAIDRALSGSLSTSKPGSSDSIQAPTPSES